MKIFAALFAAFITALGLMHYKGLYSHTESGSAAPSASLSCSDYLVFKAGMDEYINDIDDLIEEAKDLRKTGFPIGNNDLERLLKIYARTQDFVRQITDRVRIFSTQVPQFADLMHMPEIKGKDIDKGLEKLRRAVKASEGPDEPYAGQDGTPSEVEKDSGMFGRMVSPASTGSLEEELKKIEFRESQRAEVFKITMEIIDSLQDMRRTVIKMSNIQGSHIAVLDRNCLENRQAAKARG